MYSARRLAKLPGGVDGSRWLRRRLESSAMSGATGKPSRAYAIVGASSRAIGCDPKRPCSANQPSTQPGTLTASGPLAGICVSPRRFSSASVIARGERPLALRP